MLLVVLLVACRHEAERAGEEWKILFVSERDGEWATHAVNPDGSGRIRVAPNDGPALGTLVPSPDGTRAILPGSGELRVVESGEPGSRRLAGGDPTGAAWSPDGEQIVFSGLTPGLSIIDADGENGRQLTRTRDDREPAWSPDGRSIAFVRFSKGVMVLDRDGGRSRVLWGKGRYAAQLRWSADGESLSFVAPTNGSVVTISVATGTVLRVRRGVDEYSRIAWSPDGREFAYSSRPGLFAARVDGSHRRRLAANGTDPVWAPDGRSIVYVVGTQHAGSQLWSTRPDGTGKRRLTSPYPNGGYALEPAWMRGPLVESPSPYRFRAVSRRDGAILRSPYAVATIGAAGSVVALAAPPRVWTPVWVVSPPLVLWDAATGRVTRVARPSCSGVAANVVVLRDAVAFDCGSGHAASFGSSVQFFELARPYPVSLAYGLVSEGCEPSELPGMIAGAGDVLVFSRTPVRCWKRRSLPQTLWRADGKRLKRLVSGPNAAEPTAVDGNRIAVERDDGVVTILRANGTVIGRLDPGMALPKRNFLASRRPSVGLSGASLVVLRGGRLRVFAVPALRPVRSSHVPLGATFAGIARGLVAYVVGPDVYVHRLADGHTTTVRTAGRDVEAQITSAGLFYAVHRRRMEDFEHPPFDRNPAEVVFLRRDALVRRFRTSR